MANETFEDFYEKFGVESIEPIEPDAEFEETTGFEEFYDKFNVQPVDQLSDDEDTQKFHEKFGTTPVAPEEDSLIDVDLENVTSMDDFLDTVTGRTEEPETQLGPPPEEMTIIPEFETAAPTTTQVDIGQPQAQPEQEVKPLREGAPPVGTEEIIVPAGTIPARKPIPSTPLAATLVGVTDPIPFVGPKGIDVDRLRKEHPGSVTAGGAVTQIGLALIGGSGVAALLGKTALSKTPILLNAVSRAITAGGIRGVQSVENVIEGKESIKEAMFNTIVESAGGAAFSVIPEIKFSTNAIQLILQPLADVMYQAGVDAIKSGDQNVFSAEWFKQQIPTIAAAAGFAVNDIGRGRLSIQEPAKIKPVEEVPGVAKPAEEIAPGIAKDIEEVGIAKTELEKSLELERKQQKAAPEKGIPSELKQLQAIKEDFRSTGLPATKKGFQDYWKETTGETLSREDAGIKMKQILGSTEKDFITGKTIPETPVKPVEAPKVPKGQEKILEPPVPDTEPIAAKKPPVEDKLRKLSEVFEKKATDALKRIDERATKGVRLGAGLPLDDIADMAIFGASKIARGATDFAAFSVEMTKQFGDIVKPHLNDLYNKSVEEFNKFSETKIKSKPVEPIAEVGKPVPEPIIKKTEPALPKEDVTPERGMPDPLETMKPEEIPGQKTGDPEFSKRRGFSSSSGKVGGGKQKKTKFKDPAAQEMQKILDNDRKQVKDKFGFNKDRFIDKTLSRFIDVGAPWKRRILKQGGKDVVMKMDLSRGASGEANRIYETAEKNIYDKIPRGQEEEFADFLQTTRSVELLKLKGADFKTPGMEKNQNYLDDLQAQNPEAYKRYQEAGQKYWDKISKEPLRQMVEEGLMEKSLAAKLLSEQAHYSPRRFIQHIDADAPSFDSKGNLISVPDSGLKKLDKGSEQALISNPRLLLAQVQARTQSRIFKNRAQKALYDFAKNNPDNSLGVKIPKGDKTPSGFTRISAMIKGKKQDMLMPTEMAQYWVTQDSKMSQDMGKWIQILSGSALLKPMATGLNPGFALSNLPRDIMHSWFVTKEYSPILPFAWAQQAKDMFTVLPDVIARKGRVVDYSKEGGSLDLLTQQGQLQKKPWEVNNKLSRSINGIQKFMGWAGETSELLTRIALRERGLKNGRSPQEATWNARNYIDFAQGGSWTKFADKGIPYLNAGVQGTRGVVRAFKESPGIATFKAAQIISFGMALAYWNRRNNEEAWDSISEREKTGKFIITTPYQRTDKDGNKRYIYFAIPKDQGQRLFATVGEEFAEYLQTGKTNFEKIRKSATDFFPVDQSSVIPPSMSAFLGYVYNKDFWRNDDIWKGRKNVSPKLEIYNETPKPWVLWGEATGLSPVRSRRAFNKLVPMNAYTMLLEAAGDQMHGALTGKEKDEISRPFLSHLANSPISRKLIRETWPRGETTDKLLEQADKFQIETHLDNGKQVPFEELKRNVEAAQRQENDKKITNDQNFDFLATAAIAGNLDTKMNFQNELDKLSKTDVDEWKRVRRRIKRKFPKHWIKLLKRE